MTTLEKLKFLERSMRLLSMMDIGTQSLKRKSSSFQLKHVMPRCASCLLALLKSGSCLCFTGRCFPFYSELTKLLLSMVRNSSFVLSITLKEPSARFQYWTSLLSHFMQGGQGDSVSTLCWSSNGSVYIPTKHPDWFAANKRENCALRE